MDAGEWWDAGCSGAPTPGGEGVSVHRPAALQGPVPLNANDMPLGETGLTGWFLGAPRGTASAWPGPNAPGQRKLGDIVSKAEGAPAGLPAPARRAQGEKGDRKSVVVGKECRS